MCNSTLQLQSILGLSPILAGSTAWALDCHVGWMWCRNPGLGFSSCGSETLPCCAALGKSLHLSGPPPSPLKHGRREVRSGLALSFSNSTLLRFGIKLGGCVGIDLIPRQAVKNIISLFSQIQIYSAVKGKTPMTSSDSKGTFIEAWS